MTLRTTLPPLALSVVLGGCTVATRDTTPAPAAAPIVAAPLHAPAADNAHREREIRAVLDMQQRGELTDAQALKLIARLNGVGTDTAPVPAKPETGAMPPAPRAKAVAAAESTAKVSGYKAACRLTGRLRSVGSDSMDRVMARWTRDFVAFHPELRTSHEGKGSSTAVPALMESRADFGPMSRPLKAEELAAFETRFGYSPTQIRTAVDALAVYIHPANPLSTKGLSMAQVDAAFSAVRKRGGKQVVTWGDLGATGEWAAAPVRCYSRNSASGTYGFFKDEVLLKGDFRGDTQFLPGSAEVVSAVAGDKYGIGYSGIGYKTDKVAALPIIVESGKPAVVPDEAAAVTGRYPIARSLSLVIHRKPGEAASDLHREFITYTLSPEGQAAVRAEGYFPLPEAEVAAELVKLRYNAQ